ncbi:MAG: hypothetical protein WC241_00565 [Candidatus Paceibacterota bacterium]|jgi:hypothetical protein
MKKNELVLMVTNFDCVAEDGSYLAKENDLKEKLNGDRVRFFHQKFQSKFLTLARILKQEREGNEKIHVVFQKEVPIKKATKIIKQITEKLDEEQLIFSSVLTS